MAGKLSFSIAINLLTQQFKRGTSEVKAAFRSIQMQALSMAAALGAGGLGLSNLVSRLVETAKAADRAQTALRNVSGGAAAYASNLQYLTQLSKRYGIEVNSLTDNYAKFIAAASASGMSVADQRKIFEAMSRATAAFGLNADQSNRAFTALQQMMSKGKVSAEELRQQMGEQIPIAFQAMAKAAGTTTAGLDELLKQGKVVSAEVLPKFAEALESMLPEINTDNLAASLNTLQNTFTSLTQKLNTGGIYKSLVDGLNDLLAKVRDGLSGIVAFIISMLSGKLLLSAAAFFKKIDATLKNSVAQAEKAEKQKQLATEQRIAAQKRLEVAQTAFEQAEGNKRYQAYRNVERAESALKKAAEAEKRAAVAATAAAEKAAAAQSATLWGRVRNVGTGAWASISRSLRGIVSIPMLVITAISSLIGSLKQAYDEAKRIADIVPSYRREMDKAGNTAEVAKMQKLLDIMNDRHRKQEEINAAQTELQKMLGNEKLSQEELNSLVAKRVSLLKEQARAELASTKIAETEDRQSDLAKSVGATDEQMSRLMELSKQIREEREKYRTASPAAVSEYNSIITELNDKRGGIGAFGWDRTEAMVQDALKEYLQNQIVLNQATDDLAKSQAAAAALVNEGAGGTGENTELEKQQQAYARQLRELEARRKVEAMTVDEYNRAYADITKSALIGALSAEDKSVGGSDWARKLAQDYTAAMARVTESATRALTDEIEQELDAERPEPQSTPILRQRDTTFDYKKSQADILGEQIDIWKEYRDQLQRNVAAGAEEMRDSLNGAMAEVDSLEEALKLAQVRQDVQDLSDELRDSLYGGVKDMASSMDRVTSALENVRDVFNDVDASPWERIMAVWNAMVSTVDAFLSVTRTIENVSALAAKLSGAKKQEQSLAEATLGTAASKAVEMGADAVATKAFLKNSQKKTAAATTEMASKSTAAYAEIPIVGPVLAAAQIATMKAMILAASKDLPGFAGGGIFTGGTATGDKGLARMNRGEMVLTTGQQARLFHAIASGQLGGTAGGRVEIGFDRVRGSDIYLALKNYTKSTGKTL